MAKQKIFFGPPGTGKSYEIDKEKASAASIRTVFYPDYSYGDFVGKLTPVIQGNQVVYEYQLGPFLQALALSYKTPEKDVYLIIEELNRGNSSAIFGNVFQLLDRDVNGVSQYWVSIPKQAFLELIEKIGLKKDILSRINDKTQLTTGEQDIINKIKNKIVDFETYSIKLPSNFNILCTMNSSDHSIFYMDSAFKRRWDWQFFDLKNGRSSLSNQINYGSKKINWVDWVDQLNQWLSQQAKNIKMIENKQIGYFFINKKNITEDDIKQKVMFFLWDSVFDRDKKPLIDLLGPGITGIVNFGDFIKHSTLFIENINK
jgi:5-methylcytosine-specific restriction protein B